ncbi:hypothetical protein [Sphingomonas sp. BK345]|uniref:hypothetical protein n=1 Tax=Sphingomonas sp. BK345 TaxID=2586980 RepID=UPI001618D238|nr:hypothetical protein [Sphingomonas sp. BK345]MBB3475599.1 hypothetical protein [Sphingomonas sp. BK345]
MPFAFRHIEATFAELHRVKDEKRVALRARLKHLQRLKFPDGVNTGTGKAAAYTAPQMLLIGLTFELLQLGIRPEPIVSVLRENEREVATAAGIAADRYGSDEPYLMWLTPYGLSDLMTDEEDQAYTTVDTGEPGTLAELMTSADVLWSRLAVVNVMSVVKGVAQILERQDGGLAAEFLTGLREWSNNASNS